MEMAVQQSLEDHKFSHPDLMQEKSGFFQIM